MSDVFTAVIRAPLLYLALIISANATKEKKDKTRAPLPYLHISPHASIAALSLAAMPCIFLFGTAQTARRAPAASGTR